MTDFNQTNGALMKLSVIIPCLNGANTIATQLEALANQRWSKPWELIVSDNGSTDESIAVVEQHRNRLPNLRIVDASDRRGSAHARNVGARAATSDALAFCDADDEVAPGWVAAMGEALSQYDFVAGRIDTEKLNSSWVQRVFHDHPRRYGLLRASYPPLPYAGGCNLGVKRSLHEAVGGFDESLLRLEDNDYCFRIQLTGVELHYVPDAIMHYRRRDTLGGFFRQACHWALYEVFLFKKYRQPPDMKISQLWKQYVSLWGQLLLTLTYIRQKKDFARWLWITARQIGLLFGSIRFCTPPPPQPSELGYYVWMKRVHIATREIARLVPRGNAFILVDESKWSVEIILGRRAIPFHWVPDDETAIREFKRLQQSGASFIVFGWPAFWWLDYYLELNHHLRSSFRCVLHNDRLVVFDLRS